MFWKNKKIKQSKQLATPLVVSIPTECDESNFDYWNM